MADKKTRRGPPLHKKKTVGPSPELSVSPVQRRARKETPKVMKEIFKELVYGKTIKSSCLFYLLIEGKIPNKKAPQNIKSNHLCVHKQNNSQ
jgi:hypothetical protein